MTSSPDSTEPVGVVLARWRRRRKLTGQALADQVGMSQAKISRLETGSVSAEPGDVRLLAEALDIPAAEVRRLVDLAEHVGNQLTDWTPAGPGTAVSQDEIGRMESSTRELRVFQPAVIPGLLQTSEYARGILAAINSTVDDGPLSAVAVSKAVSARMQRNQVLDFPDHEFHFLIIEQVLRNRVCKPADMIAQIDRMREVATFPNVHLRIVTDDTDLPVAPFHGFVTGDERWVSIDLFNTNLTSKGRKTVRTYRRVFESLERVAQADVGDLLDRYQDRYVRMLMPNSVAG